MDDDAIRAVARLCPAHPSGGTVVERAATLAEGTGFDAVSAHGGEPEASSATASTSGLYGSRIHDAGSADPRAPSRFVLRPGVLR